MKWGDSFQLTSSGIDTSVATLTKVLRKVAQNMGKNNMSTNELGTLQLIIEQIANKFENRTGTVTQAEADRMMSDINKAGGLNEQLQQILGSRKTPSGAAAYDAFKFELTKECMTGELTFAGDRDKAADHLLTEHGLKPINEAAIREVMKKAGVRFSKKGRGKTKLLVSVETKLPLGTKFKLAHYIMDSTLTCYNNGIETEESLPNTHLDHLEDLIFTGRGQLLNALREIYSGVRLSVKWDGAPAIVFGTDPRNGKFFVGTKSVFNKVKVKICYDQEDIDKYYKGNVADILRLCLRHLPRLTSIIQA